MRLISLILLIVITNVNAQVPFDMIPGNFVRQGKVIWSCLPAMRSILVCDPIPIDKFCQVEKKAFDKGILACVRPMMADDKQEEG